MADGATAEVLLDLERRLLSPAVRADRAQLEALLGPGFREIGSSGRLFDRESILAELLLEANGLPPRRIKLHDFHCQGLAADTVLVTYRSRELEDPGREALRSSIWQRQDGRWTMCFHQGTPALPGDGA